jgi:hypothetical protein
MSSSGWLVVILALLGANLPFFNQRCFALIPLPVFGSHAADTRLKTASKLKPIWFRLIELIVCYFVVGSLAYMLEARAGNVFTQGWQFYAITFSLFLVFAFPGFTVRYLLK